MTHDNKRYCIVCESRKSDVYLDCGEYVYYRCRHCSGIYVSPLHDQSFYLETETYLSNPTADYADHINPLGQRWMAEQLERLWVSKLGTLERGRLLEIGAGTGFFELVALARGWEVEGIELSEGAVEFARKYMHVPIKQSTIEEYTSSHLFDAIVMIEVLEHFRDPLEAIRSLKKLSTGHTLIFGTTPNTDSKHWLTSQQNIYVPEDHLFLFNTKSLQLFADKAGIYDVSIEYFGSGENNDSNLMFAGIISS